MNKKRQAMLMAWMMLGAALAPNTAYAKVDHEETAIGIMPYKEQYDFLQGEGKVFNGTAESLEDLSNSIGMLNSDTINFGASFKTATNKFQSLFFVGTNKADPKTNYIAMYMNGGKRIGVEMKGVSGGYVHFYVDLSKPYSDNEWHEVGLKIVEDKGYRIVVDGVEHTPTVASGSQTQTRFVPDALFEANIFSLGGARRGDSFDWLFDGMIRNVKVESAAFIDGSPAPEVGYRNVDLTAGNHTGRSIEEDLEKLVGLDKGSVSITFRRDPQVKEIQNLISVSNKDRPDSYGSIFVWGNKIGYEFKEQDKTLAVHTKEVKSLEGSEGWHNLTITFDKTLAKAYLDGEKIFEQPCKAFFSGIKDANTATLGYNNRTGTKWPLNGKIDRVEVFEQVLEEDYILENIHQNTLGEKVIIESYPRPIPPKESVYRAAADTDIFRMPSLGGDPEVMGGEYGFRIPALVTSKTEDPQDKDVIIAIGDKGNEGADWGNVDVAIRRSLDGGETFSAPIDTILDSPCRIAPQGFHDYYSAFYIDAVVEQAESGKVLLLVDMFPESKGLHNNALLSNGTGYQTIDGEDYLMLFDGPPPNNGNVYTVREEGWIYDAQGQKTSYYIPQTHDPEYAYQTMGDMYYAKGEADYLNEVPPMVPTEPVVGEEGADDVYVGNIYLNLGGKPTFSTDQPQFVKKRLAGPGGTSAGYDRESKYETYETDPAPLTAQVTSYLWLTTSDDHGETWSQPVDITPQVKKSQDGKFLGTGPGRGLCLKYQKDTGKNGRIIMPVYNLGDQAAAIYTDDEGITWGRSQSSQGPFIVNSGEVQMVELMNGTVLAFGRRQGETPVSRSLDGGETWESVGYTGLSAARCQKSLITYPIDGGINDETADTRFDYPEGLVKGKQYVIASHTKGPNRDFGTISLGEVQEDESIVWIAERRLRRPGEYTGQSNPDFFAYSCLTILEDGNIGVLFEPYPNNYIAYTQFNLEWILNGDTPGTILEPNIIEKSYEAKETPHCTGITLDILADQRTTPGMIQVGDTLRFTLDFTENVFAVGETVVPIEIGGQSREAVYESGSGKNQLAYSYRLTEEDLANKEVKIAAYQNVVSKQTGVIEDFKNRKPIFSNQKVQFFPQEEVAKDQMQIKVNTQTLQEGEKIEVTVAIETAEHPVYAQDLQVVYDSERFSLEKIETVDEKIELVGREEGEDRVRLLIAAPGGLLEGQEILKVYFEAKPVDEDCQGEIATQETLWGIVVADESLSRSVQGEQVTVTITDQKEEIKNPEDINQDQVIDIADLALVAYYYHANTESTNWEMAKQADVVKDGEINLLDLTAVAHKILEK